MSDTEGTSVRQVPIENLRLDMVVARDVVTYDGKILIAKDTMLSDVHLKSFTKNFIGSISIKESTIHDESAYLDQNHETDENKGPVAERAEFKVFREEYVEKSDELKNVILSISDGGEIDLEKVYELTEGMMNKLRYKSDVFAYLSNLRDMDEPTFTHSTNVSLLTNLFGRWIGMDENELIRLTVSASLHDLGKVKIPPEILTKPDRLTDAEYKIMKKHTVYGYRMIENHNIPHEIKLAALTHHEKIDGSGYPMGLKGDRITNFSKIITICDIYDAMTANRVYRGKVCPFDVIKSFEQASYGHLDTKYLFVFLQNIAHTYLGCDVVLDDGRKAEIVFIHQNDLSRPIVRISEELVDLATMPGLKIAHLVN